MFERLFGKKNSIQRKLTISFVTSIIVISIITFLLLNIYIDYGPLNKIISVIESHIKSDTEIQELISTVRRVIFLLLFNIIAITIIVVKTTSKKIINPIKTITKATKEVSSGNLDIKLESQRDDEIGELTYNFNQMTKDLRSTENLQKEFIDNVSHEIKTPISSIQGFAQMLKNKDLSQNDREEYAQIIIDESNRILNLSNSMLKLSKLQHQTKILNKETINITEQIRRIIAVLENKWSEKEIVFNINMEEKFFTGDEELIYQMWMNLIDNAIKFSKPKGKVDISLKEENNFIIVKIQDNGKGMSEEETKKIFSRFYQIDKSHSEEGFGLGLPIVKRIVELSDGKIEIESKENIGTTITIELPVEKRNNKILIN